MNQGNRNPARVPVPDVSGFPDVSGLVPGCGQMVNDALPVMLEPVRHQHRLTVGRFDQILQHLQLPAVDAADLFVLVIDRAVGHLQQLVGKRRGVGGVDVPVLQRDDEILFELVVELSLSAAHLHLMVDRHTFRHFQVVRRLHGDGDVADSGVDALLRAGERCVAEHHSSGWVSAGRLEVGFPEAANEAAQTLAAVQNADFRPQIHQAVGGGRAG